MENEGYKRIIENLRGAIQESGLKQNAIAERIGKDPKTLSNIMCFRQRLAVEDIAPLCNALNITPNRLYFGNTPA